MENKLEVTKIEVHAFLKVFFCIFEFVGQAIFSGDPTALSKRFNNFLFLSMYKFINKEQIAYTEITNTIKIKLISDSVNFGFERWTFWI